MLCKICGGENKETARFCNDCGSPLRRPEPLGELSPRPQPAAPREPLVTRMQQSAVSPEPRATRAPSPPASAEPQATRAPQPTAAPESLVTRRQQAATAAEPAETPIRTPSRVATTPLATQPAQPATESESLVTRRRQPKVLPELQEASTIRTPQPAVDLEPPAMQAPPRVTAKYPATRAAQPTISPASSSPRRRPRMLTASPTEASPKVRVPPASDVKPGMSTPQPKEASKDSIPLPDISSRIKAPPPRVAPQASAPPKVAPKVDLPASSVPPKSSAIPPKAKAPPVMPPKAAPASSVPPKRETPFPDMKPEVIDFTPPADLPPHHGRGDEFFTQPSPTSSRRDNADKFTIMVVLAVVILAIIAVSAGGVYLYLHDVPPPPPNLKQLSQTHQQNPVTENTPAEKINMPTPPLLLSESRTENPDGLLATLVQAVVPDAPARAEASKPKSKPKPREPSSVPNQMAEATARDPPPRDDPAPPSLAAQADTQPEVSAAAESGESYPANFNLALGVIVETRTYPSKKMKQRAMELWASEKKILEPDGSINDKYVLKKSDFSPIPGH